MKQSRQSAIIDLINQHEIETQEELAQMLKERGYLVTQATVSRDIKELRLMKVINEKGIYKYAQAWKADENQADEKQRTIFRQSVLSIDFAQNIVVIKTYSGMAQAAAFVIDTMNIKEVVGSIAGDDTILCVTKNEQIASILTGKLKLLL